MYNYSARRKQGLGSLRPGYQLGGPTDILIGNLLNWGVPKVWDYATKSKEQREDEKLAKDLKKLGIYGYFPEEYSRNDNNKGTTKSSGWKSFGGGLMNLLATAMLGPLMGPLALTVGRGIMNKSKGLGFTGGNTLKNIGPQPGKVTTLGGKTVDFGSDEYVRDMKARDKAFQETGDYDVYSDTGKSTQTYSPPDPSKYTYEGSDEQDEASNYGGSSSTAGAGMSRDDDSWSSSPFFKGGRVSYSKGGIASLWQR